jgi:flagellar biosynthesis protein FlhA
MLLMLTLFRLSLNVASTRLILSKGYAGNLIEAFGSFVVQGNFVIGIIIFAVLIIINFIVITKGAGRIAEVSARFTLDAMPGKQMAIDADLAAGLITDEEAKTRRSEISREADFYGAMDGASKFVRGDVIAGLLITFINIIGGLIIGTMQQGMPLLEAAQKYTLLTVGDGLVSQIPSLLISTAAGIIVSRAASEGNLSFEITGQLFGNPRILALAGVFIVLVGIVPGLPIIPFWGIAGFLFYKANQTRNEQEEARIIEEEEQKSLPAAEEDKVEDYLVLDTLELEIGYSLIPLVDPNQDGDLLDRMASLRKQLAVEMGILVPPIRIRDNIQLNSNDYVIKMRGIVQGKGDLLPDYYMVLVPPNFDIELSGIKTTDPTFGMDALWVSERNKQQAERYGLSVIEAPAVITTHLMEVLKRNAHKLLDREMVKKLVDNVKENNSALVDELIPDGLKVGEVQKVLKRLLKEQIAIRDLVTILETLADHQSTTKNTDVLTEYVRAALSENITKMYRNSDGEITVSVLSSELEAHLISQAQQGNLNPNTLGFAPDTVEKLYLAASKTFERMISSGHDPILLTSPVLRPVLYDFMVTVIPEVSVLSYNDITIDTQIRKFERIQLKEELEETLHEV